MPSQPRSHHARLLLVAALCAAARAALPHAAAAPTIYLTDRNGGGTDYEVPGYTAAGAAAPGYTTPASFSNLQGVAVSSAANTLYVADFKDSQILTFDATTGAATSNAGFNNTGGLNQPFGLALAGGNLLAANYGGNNIVAFNPATGAAGTGFVSPSGLNNPFGIASAGGTLFVSNTAGGGATSGFVGAYSLTTGAAVTNFVRPTGLNDPTGLAVYGNDLFVANFNGGTVGEYNATTGAVINANFLTGLSSPDGLAVLGNNLLVTLANGTTVAEYGIPATATTNNTPTSADTSFITGLNNPRFIAVSDVPEPATWLGGAGLTLAAAAALRRRRA